MTEFVEVTEPELCVRCGNPILPGTKALAESISYHTVCVPLIIDGKTCTCTQHAEEHEPHCALSKFKENI